MHIRTRIILRVCEFESLSRELTVEQSDVCPHVVCKPHMHPVRLVVSSIMCAHGDICMVCLRVCMYVCTCTCICMSDLFFVANFIRVSVDVGHQRTLHA